VESPDGTDKKSVTTLGMVGAKIVDVFLAQLAVFVFPHHGHDEIVDLPDSALQKACAAHTFLP
jgi:hypothetical protein